MGLPEINIEFKSLAKSAIERSSKDIVALILRDINCSGKVISLENTKNIPKELSKDNIEQLELAFKGGYKIPSKVIFYALKEEEILEEALNAMEAEVWDRIAIPCLQDGEADKVVAWIKKLREDNIKVQAVLPDCKADSEGIINFTTTPIKVGEKEYTNIQYCSRISGILAGTPLNISTTYFVLPEVTDVPHIKKSEADKKIDAGELIIINDGEKCKIGRGVNSLTTITEGKSEEYKKIKIVSIMDLVDRDVRKTYEDKYVGKCENSYDDQVNFVVSVNDYLEELERNKLLAKKSSHVAINFEKIKLYWKDKGMNIDALTKKEIEEMPAGSKVFLKGKIRPLDAMEDLDLGFDM